VIMQSASRSIHKGTCKGAFLWILTIDSEREISLNIGKSLEWWIVEAPCAEEFRSNFANPTVTDTNQYVEGTR
jgi:hypothetical protein